MQMLRFFPECQNLWRSVYTSLTCVSVAAEVLAQRHRGVCLVYLRRCSHGEGGGEGGVGFE